MGRNIARDRFVNRQLRRLGWTVIRIWEHELGAKSEGCVRRIGEAMGRWKMADGR